MKILLLDKNLTSFTAVEAEALKAPDFEIAAAFSTSDEAVNYASQNTVDVVFIGENLSDTDGISALLKLREINKSIIAIFVTANDADAANAIRAKFDYVVFKPCTNEDVADALTRARYLAPRLEKRIKATLFGKFDLYVSGQRVLFSTKKSKELAALCISQRGGTVSTYEIIEKLWVGSSVTRASETSGYRKAIKSMLETFKEYGIDYIFERKYGSCRIAHEDIECDYYRLLDYDKTAAKAYGGAILPEYHWSEEMKKHADELVSIIK